MKKVTQNKGNLTAQLSAKKVTLISIISLVVLGFVLSQVSGSSNINEKDESGPKTKNGVIIDAKVSDKLKSKSIEFWYQFTGFDPKSGSLSTNTYIWPSSDLAKIFSSSAISNVSISAFIDNLSSVTSYDYKPGSSIGANLIVIDGTNPLGLQNSNEFFYPFDQYSLDSYVKIKNSDLGSKEITQNSNTYEFFWPSQVPGFVFDVWRGATFADDFDWFDSEAYEGKRIDDQRAKGEISVLIKVARSDSVKFASLFVYIGMLLACFALSVVTLYVVRAKRPPSITALVWAAAQILGLYQLRELLPDEPRIGILLDLLIFFPGVMISILCAAILAIFWVKRDSFEI
jgi:hypothetical protein